jgi:YD repeat-containing protein
VTLLPLPCHALDKTVTVQAGVSTGTTTAWAATGLTLCTPVPGTTGSVTISPQHGTVALTGVTFTIPTCGTAEFSGTEAFYTWTDTVGLPGGGSDFFQVTFNGPPSVPGTTISNITICLNFGCKAVVPPSCPCNATDAGATATNTGQVSGGEPIDIGSGNVSYRITDYQTAGQNPLAFTRYYNSAGSITSFAKTLTSNWRSNFDGYIDIVSSNAVNVERGNGQVLTFNLSGTTWVPDTDVDVTLTHSGSTWTLTDEKDTVETYTSVIYLVAGAVVTIPNGGQLNSRKYRNGYTQTLSYNGANQLVSVVDSYNRKLSFTYSAGLLQQVTTPDGTTISFGYSPVSVAAQGIILLGNNALTSVSYSTSPLTSQTYLYENTALPFALTGVIDENGNRFATWTYDSKGRGLTSQQGAGANLTTITYNDTDGSRTVTNPLGQVESFKFTTLQFVPKITEIDRQATATTASAKRLFTYDTNGYIATETDWNANQTSFVNNSHGLPTTITEAVGSSVSRVTTIAYNTTFVHLPATITTPGLTATFTYDASGEQLTRTLTDTTTTTTPYSTKGQTRTWTNTWNNFLLTSTKNPNGNTTTLAYDASGALTKITNALNQSTNITAHTGGGLPLTIVDPNSVTTTLTYNARQWPLTSTISTNAGPLTTTWTYDAAGNLINTILPDNSNLAETYDTAHRIITVTDALSNAINFTLDALGDRTLAKIANASAVVQAQRSSTFDPLGRTLQDIGGVGQTTA